MILAINAGNTRLTLGVFHGEEIAFTERVSTDLRRTELEYAVIFRNILAMHSIAAEKIMGAIIASVVPPLVQVLHGAIAKLMPRIRILTADSSVPTGVPLIIDEPEQLGTDQIVNAAAAVTKYGAPVIVINFGTAVTITVIDKYSCCIGGANLPGVQLSLNSLVSGTAQLPNISLTTPESVLGRNTVDSMRSGVIFGNAAAIDGMIDRIWKERGYESTNLAATGDLAEVIIPCCRHSITVDRELPLHGLRIIYDIITEGDAPECC